MGVEMLFIMQRDNLALKHTQLYSKGGQLWSVE